MAEGTVKLREGLDVNLLGQTPQKTTPARRSSEAGRTSMSRNTSAGGAGLVVVPPTPEPPSQDRGEEQDGNGGHGRRRGNGVYRGIQGAVASTPDLRKKGKEKEGHGGKADTGCGERFLSPGSAHHQNGTGPRLRGSSSTSSFSMVSASGAGGAPRTPGKDEESGTDWGVTSPRSRSGSKSGKSMRLRATNFFGKMLGQSSQDSVKSRKNSSASYTPPPLFAQYAKEEAPPVPQLPETYRSNGLPSAPPSLDVFGAPDLSKPLPSEPKSSTRSIEGEEHFDESTIMDMLSPGAADRTIKSHSRGKQSVSSMRRRSASVSDVDSKKISLDIGESLLPKEVPRSAIETRKASTLDWDTNGIMSIFKNDLSGLEAIAPTSLEIKDPSTPARRDRLQRSPSALESRNESVGTIKPKISGRASTSAIDIRDSLKVDTTDSGRASPLSVSAGSRSSLVIPESHSPVQSPSTGRRTTTSRSANPPLSASALYTPRTVSSPLLGSSASPSAPAMGNAKSRSATAPVSFANPFTTQPSVVVSSSTPVANRRESVQSRPSLSFSEPALMPGDESNVQRRQSQPTTPDPSRSVRLIPSSSSFHTSAYSSQVDVALDASPSKSIASSSSLALPRGTSMEVGEDVEAKGQELAKRFWEDDESLLSKEKFAEWLGGAGRLNAIALQHYVDFYDFKGLRLDHAFRRFCAKLYLKGETQQIDRILSQFSRRYWECNPNSIYGNASLVHAVAYSILLLNTDLHIAELATHMSRTQFVRNTLQAIQSQIRPNGTRASTPELTHDEGSIGHGHGRTSEGSDPGGNTVRTKPKRSSSVHSWTSVSKEAAGLNSSVGVSTPAGSSSQTTSTVSVDTPTSAQTYTGFEPKIRNTGSQTSVTSMVYGRPWEIEMETMLREIYSAVKSQEIRQPKEFQLPANQLLAPNTPYSTLYRHRSQRGQDRMAMLKRGSLRGLQSLLGQQPGASPYSSNSSIDGRGRVSPSPSFATSDGDIPASSAYFTPALGFASNLSHTIIREAQEDDLRSITSRGSDDTDVSISDEELALLGAPWAKEGMLCRKQYWESHGKRAKSKQWQDVFVVIQKGELDMFVFGAGGGGSASTAVGGGNWLANAQHVGNIVLAHSLAHILPPPGYNRQRPHCFALTLANGGVYFFQAGTEDLLNEWVSTCNYWAARQSKEPLSGGVSNMEYGWNRVLDPLDQVTSMHNEDAMSVVDNTDTFSVRSFKSKASDRIHINEWKAPLPSTVASTHDEETQLEALRKQIEVLTKELQTHNELRKPMMTLYSSRSSNLGKASTNWEKKSQYLLAEIVKYETYVESLKTAMSLRLKKRGEKALEKALVDATPVDADFTNGKRHRKNSSSPGDETITGHEPEPTSSHRREGAKGDDDDDE